MLYSSRLTPHSSHLFQRFYHFRILRKPPLLVLGEYHGLVGLDIKDAAAALDQLGIDADAVLDLGRQTGSPGFIISLYAIGNRNMHDTTHFNI